ncbi:SDR family oxidoreductase [Tessaracoccus sp. OS52]|uniref:SDR family NAD(P)-dependent oxidoreductase n=1 Tax=Tessaracoccus sp. OS52 TaxID=2886691 RepID=UPI001D11C10E|nr:SDR family oxidoreductase [Tessaracoccus sp. OS52]MCC2593951.1 SDR family oxidoreductase [Tessaracoccus sp. OS52]
MADGGLFNLQGRVALVTGASEGGLGFWSARGLAAQGAAVAVSDIGSVDSLDSVKQAVEGEGAPALALPADLTDPDQVDHLVDAVVEKFGRVDILVNHSGINLRKPAFETTLEEWNRVIQINLTATFLTARAVASKMVQQGSGSIINTSSIYTNIVGPLPEPAYYASKAGVANLTRGLASEWGPSGVRVNCVAPGLFYPTRMTAALGEDPERLAQMTSKTLLGRLGDPERDLAGTVVWLASDAAAYVTGQIIYVDGGWTAN